MGEGALVPLINDNVDRYDRYEHVGEGVFIAPLIQGLRPPAKYKYHLRNYATNRGSPLSHWLYCGRVLGHDDPIRTDEQPHVRYSPYVQEIAWREFIALAHSTS